MVQDVITAINAVGLPTVVAVASMWYVKYREDKNDVRIDKLNEAHKKEMTDITEALNNNTLALQRICDTFEQKREA
nr:MAG TPA: YvrJ protein family protein [Caudoviricetes sp.]